MRGHVDAESLALYAEGELSRGRAARVRAHLSGCPDCAATLAALAEVTTQLSHVPAPPMPSAVAARLDAALSAEAAHRAAAPAPAPAGASPAAAAAQPDLVPGRVRILAGTAVTLVVAGGVGYAVSQFSGSRRLVGRYAPRRAAGHSSAAAAQRHPGGPSGRRVVKRAPPRARPGPPGVRADRHRLPARHARRAGQASAASVRRGGSGPHLLPPASVPVRCATASASSRTGAQCCSWTRPATSGRPAIVIVLGKPDTVIVVSHSCAPLHSARLP